MAVKKEKSARAANEDLNVRLAKDVSKFVHDPLGYVLYTYEWGSGELTGIDGPEEWQAEVMGYIGKCLRKNPYEPIRVARSSGHGIGKSALVSWLTEWALATCPNTRVMMTANTYQQLMTKTWPEQSVWNRRSLLGHWFNIQKDSMHYVLTPGYDDTWRADAVTWSVTNTEAFAGLHNKGNRILIIFDEASAIVDKIWEVVEGAMTDANTEIIWCVFGNPTRNTGRFRECFRRYRSYWNARRIDSRTVRITNKRLLQSWADMYGEDSDFFRIRVTGEFPNQASGQLIPTDLVQEAMRRNYPWSIVEGQPKIFGVDVARQGEDSTVVYMRQGLYSKRLLKVHGDDTTAITDKLVALIHEENPDHVFLDMGNVGAAIYDNLKRLGYTNVSGVYFGQRASDERMYGNKRIEMWDKIRIWLENGGMLPSADLPDNEGLDIENDLIAPEYYFTPREKKMLERKEDMKSRGLPSPDDGDALALTFAAPVRLSGTIESINVNKGKPVLADSSWDMRDY